VSRPKVPGNTKRERLALLRSVGCPPELLDAADYELRKVVTPLYIPAPVRDWRVIDRLTDSTARRVVELVQAAPDAYRDMRADRPRRPPDRSARSKRPRLRLIKGGAS
jgi:hypothetical protein